MLVEDVAAPEAIGTREPYVGPYPLGRRDPLHGRDDEVRELHYLLLGERVILVHSRSGAGKTSLIEAGLFQQLESDVFRVRDTIRVGELPTTDLNGNLNRYLYSARRSLGANVDDTAEAENLSLAKLLDSQAETGSNAREDVLFFDQFEEVLSLDRVDQAAKTEFFEQLGNALCGRRRWAVFAMREEYVAGLEPYLSYLPGQLRARFWLDYLEPRQAAEAIARPAEAAGVPFARGVPDALVARLRAIPESATDRRNGHSEYPYVDPVQLQVVCRRLWHSLPPGTTLITQRELDRSGDVEHALEEFYADQVKQVAEANGISEREIRRWFEHNLITDQRTRGQIARHGDSAGGLDFEVIRGLTKIHLVKESGPPDATWYELAHDRLIESVLLDNGRWNNTNLEEFQKVAERWEQSRSPELLLRGTQLRTAMQWADGHTAQLSQPDREFLEASNAGHQERMRWQIVLGVLGGVVAIAAMALALVWVMHEQARTLMSRDLASRASGREVADRPDLGLLLAAQGLAISDNLTTRMAALAAIDARPALRGMLRVTPIGASDLKSVTSLAFSPDDWRLVITREDGSVYDWDTVHRTVVQTPGGAFNAAVSADGSQRATRDPRTGDIRVWGPSATPVAVAGPVSSESAPKVALGLNFLVASDPTDHSLRLFSFSGAGPEVRTITTESAKVDAVAVAPNGSRFAAALHTAPGGETNKKLDLSLRVSDGPSPALLATGNEAVTAMVFSSDGQTLAVGSSEHKLWLWRAPFADPPIEQITDHTGSIQALAFSPDGKQLASASADRSVRLWNMQAEIPVAVGEPMLHPNKVTTLAFSADGTLLASGDEGGLVLLWDVTGRHLLSQALAPDVLAISSLAASPDGKTLATAGCNTGADTPCGVSAVRLWDLSQSPPQRGDLLAEQASKILDVALSPVGNKLATVNAAGILTIADAVTGATLQTIGAHKGPALAVAFSPSGTSVATVGSDNAVRLWRVNPPQQLEREFTSPKALASVAFSTDGTVLAAGGVDSHVRLWKLATGEAMVEPPAISDVNKATRVQVAFSPRGVLAYGGYDPAIRMWDYNTGRALPNLVPTAASAGGTIQSLAFNADGTRLAMVGGDNTIRMWDIDTAQEAGALTAGSGFPSRRLVFATQGKHEQLVSGSDNNVLLWDLESKAWLERLCETAARSFEPQEWRTFVGGWQGFLGQGGWRDAIGPALEPLLAPVGPDEKVCAP